MAERLQSFLAYIKARNDELQGRGTVFPGLELNFAYLRSIGVSEAFLEKWMHGMCLGATPGASPQVS